MLPLQQSGGLSIRLFSALVFPLLFIVPGVAALRVAKWSTKIDEDYDRLETLFYSLLFSTGSLLAVYFIASVLEWDWITVSSITGLDLHIGIGWYLIHLLVAILLGAAYGSFAHNYLYENEFRDHYDSWDFAFKYIQQSDDVFVKTTGGDWIKGHPIQSGKSNGTRDLLLASPVKLNYPPKIKSNSKYNIEEFEENIGTDSGERPQPEPSNSQDEVAVVAAEDQEIDSTENQLPVPVNNDQDEDQASDEDEDREFELEDAKPDVGMGKHMYVNEPDIETVVFKERSEEDPQGNLDNRDRIQERLGHLYDELGLGKVLDRVRPYYQVVVSQQARQVAMVATPILLVVALILPKLLDNPTLDQIQQLQLLLSVLIGSILGAKQQYRSILNLCVVTIVIGELVLVGFYEGVHTLLTLLVGGSIGFIIANIGTRVQQVYDSRAGWYITGLALLICLSTIGILEENGVLFHGKAYVLVGTIILVLLFIDRIQVGESGNYTGWPKFWLHSLLVTGKTIVFVTILIVYF